jgi:hypothetical protein
MEEEKSEKGFVIKDKRLFDESGALRHDAEDQAVKEETPDTSAPNKEPSTKEDDQDNVRDAYLPEVNFSNFMLSLSTTVMYHFGDFPDPVTHESVRNLEAAKHTIDTMGMLKNKTEGNLDENEKNLLEGLLFELRMRYVKETSTK